MLVLKCIAVHKFMSSPACQVSTGDEASANRLGLCCTADSVHAAQMVPMAMYFGYMFIVSYSFFCLTGTIGFFACLMFCKKIYSAVKID